LSKEIDFQLITIYHWEEGAIRMKRLVSMVLVLLVILSFAGINACSGGEKNTTAPAQSAAQPGKPAGTAAPPASPPSGDNSSWGIPVYPGSRQIMKLSSDENEIVGDDIPAVAESRTYTSPDKRADVVAFYEEKMPAGGWQEILNSDVGEGDTGSSIRQYDKNGRRELASIQVSATKKGETMIIMMW
jgi:hypothetical protein